MELRKFENENAEKVAKIMDPMNDALDKFYKAASPRRPGFRNERDLHGLIRMLGLKLRASADIGFKGLSMSTADHRDTGLEYWV